MASVFRTVSRHAVRPTITSRPNTMSSVGSACHRSRAMGMYSSSRISPPEFHTLKAPESRHQERYALRRRMSAHTSRDRGLRRVA
jgi:hypothetical protein